MKFIFYPFSALKKGLFTMQMIEECDPSLMFTIPRLAILRYEEFI